MNYVLVVSSKSDFFKIDKLFGILVSIIHKVNFEIGRHNLRKLVPIFEEIKEYNKKCYVDSGGYSIIVGDIHPRNFRIFIEYYNYFVEKYSDKADYIFSLDIPLLLKYSADAKFILDINIKSIQHTIEIIKKKEELKNKLIFVWHYKTNKLYKIWSKLFDECQVYKYFKNFSVGGMVGIRRIMKIDFTPFIAPFYRILLDCKEYNIDPNVIHFLGISNKVDRVVGAFCERLLSEYGFTKTKISYDTVRTLCVRKHDLIKEFGSEVPEFIYQSSRMTPEQFNQAQRFYIEKWIEKDIEIKRIVNKNFDIFLDNKKSINTRAIYLSRLFDARSDQLIKSLKMLLFCHDLFSKDITRQEFESKIMIPFINMTCQSSSFELEGEI